MQNKSKEELLKELHEDNLLFEQKVNEYEKEVELLREEVKKKEELLKLLNKYIEEM